MCVSVCLCVLKDFIDQKIRELGEEIESDNRECEAYQANLFLVLKDIENHKQQLAVLVVLFLGK